MGFMSQAAVTVTEPQQLTRFVGRAIAIEAVHFFNGEEVEVRAAAGTHLPFSWLVNSDGRTTIDFHLAGGNTHGEYLTSEAPAPVVIRIEAL